MGFQQFPGSQEDGGRGGRWAGDGCAVCRPGWLRPGGLFSLGWGPSCGPNPSEKQVFCPLGFMPLILQGAEIVPTLWGLEPGLPPHGPSPRLQGVRAAGVRRVRERPVRAPPCLLLSPFPLTQGLPGPKGERGEKVSGQCWGPRHFLCTGTTAPPCPGRQPGHCCGPSSSQGEPPSLAAIYQLVSQACESTIQSEDPEPSVPPRRPCPHAGQSPAPSLSSQPCLATLLDRHQGALGRQGGLPHLHSPLLIPPPPAAHVLKFDSFHKTTRPPMPILEAPGPLVTPREARLPGEGGNGGFHPEDRGTGSPSPQCPGAGWVGTQDLPGFLESSKWPRPHSPRKSELRPPLPLHPLSSSPVPPTSSSAAGAAEPDGSRTEVDGEAD